MQYVLKRMYELSRSAEPCLNEAMFAGEGVWPLVSPTKMPLLHALFDVVVGGVTDQGDFDALCRELQCAGFSFDATNGVWSNGTQTFELHVAPFEGAGNYNPWYEAALGSCQHVALAGEDGDLRVISTPYFLAALLETALVQNRRGWHLRRAVELIASDASIQRVTQRAPEGLRAFVATKARVFLEDDADLREAMREAQVDVELEALRIGAQRLSSLLDDCDPSLALAALLRDATAPPAVPAVPADAVLFTGSKTVRFADYDAPRATMTVGFEGGSVYEYFAVPKGVFDQLCASPSPGRFINSQIKDRFPYRQVTPS